MTKFSRDKGARFERQIAKALEAELGFGFRRDLSQYQQSDRGDLIPDDAAFPFLIECKARATGADCQAAWMAQASLAALNAGKAPCVIYKIGTQPIRCRVSIAVIVRAHGGQPAKTEEPLYADLSLPGFAYLAREWMAREALEWA